MPHFFASNLRAVALPARTKNFEFIFEAKSVRDESAIILAKSLAKSLHGEQKILLSKQKKGERLLVKFNKHFAPHSKEIIKSALKEYAELAGAEIASHNLNENKIKVDSAYLLDWRWICALLGGNSSLNLGNSVLGMQFRTCKNFGESTDSSLVLSPKFSQIQKPHRNHFDCDSLRKSTANQTQSAESTLDSANPTTNAESTNKAQQTIEGIAVEVVGFLGDFECKTGLESAQCSKSPKSPQDARISKLSTRDEFAFLEIGFGSGRHILHLAQKHPKAKIIGLEIYRPAISQVLRQIEILGLQNLYLASLDARVLCEILPAKCLDRMYLHFPVPWDKNPQRRVLSAQFLGNAMRALKDDGFFELLTDSAEYFAFAKTLAKGYKFKAEEGAEGEVVSKYEARWRRQEKVIYKLCIYPALNSSLGTPCVDFGNLERFADFSPFSRPKFPKNSTTSTAIRRICERSEAINTRICDLKNVDSADSQNLVKKESCEAPENSPASWCKKSGEASSSASADFLLEAEKRGSPPKSEKAAAFWEHSKKELGGAGIGVQPFLQKESSENNGEGSAESSAYSVDSAIISQNGLPHRFCESARNDDSFLDSANLTPFSPTKICKKEYFLHIKNKYIFEGGVVLFASFGAYYAPSSAYFVICGNEVSTISEIIPTRANIDALGLFMELCFDN